MFIFVSIAFAAPFRLVTPPGVIPEVLPAISPERIDVMVRGVGRDPRDLWPTPAADGVRVSRAVNLGGVWAITIWPLDPSMSLSFVEDGHGGWIAEFSSASNAPPAAHLPIPMSAVLAPVGPAMTCAPVYAAPLLPLHGADMLVDVPASAFRPEMPRWSVAEPSEISWARVSDVRMDLFVHHTPVEPSVALYELGALHRELGHSREAAYYFGEADRAGVPNGLAALQRAGALMNIQDWQGAVDSAKLAAAEGGEEDAVVTVLGTAELSLGGSNGVLLGRALAARAVTAQSSLVAGALLLRAECSKEAEAPLQRAAAQHDASGALAQLLLVDASILHGDVKGAEVLLQAVDVTGVGAPWRRQVRERRRLITLLRGTPDTWLAGVPELALTSRGKDSEGLDALYVLGQIGEQVGDEQMAVDAWSDMVSRRHGLMAGDPGRRLAAVWASRTTRLIHEGKALDALAFHTAIWRPGMLDLIADPAPLALLAQSAMEHGLYESALRAFVSIGEIEGRHGLDDRETALALAGLYLLTNRLGEASDTLDFFATRPVGRLLTDRALVLRGRVQDAKGEHEAARRIWASVRGAPEVVAEARLRIAALDVAEDRCASADLGVLLDHTVPSPTDISDGARTLLAAHCMQRTDKAAGLKGTLAAVTVSDPQSASYAAFLAGTPTPPGSAWTKLTAENQAWSAMAQRIGSGARRD